MVSIPDDVFSTYKEFADEMIASFGVNCILYYPSTLIECVNCVYDPIGQKSSNRYKHGGPMQFRFGNCPLCGGQGYKEQEVTETIRMRVYTTAREWKRFGEIVNTANASAVVIGYIYDMPKFEKANEIVVDSHLLGYKAWKYRSGSETAPWGFKHDRYFVSTLERIDG